MTAPGPNAAVQRASAGISASGIVEGALRACDPRDGLEWLDVGCGRGDLLRLIRQRHHPARLRGLDVVDFLADDLRDDIELRVGAAEELLADAPSAQRVLLVETIEHLEAPWTVLRLAARAVASGGRIVVSTPNVGSLRSRLHLLARGDLVAFQPDNAPHLTPSLPHVTARILNEEGLVVGPLSYAQVDVVPLTGGRSWPRAIDARRPALTRVSVVISARRA